MFASVRTRSRLRSRRLNAGLCALLLPACLSTRLVNLDNVDVPLPSVQPGEPWRAQIAALLRQYEQAPVLAPEDERLQPLFGGLTTLTYFGADALPRVRDQQIPLGPHVYGRSLESTCQTEPPPNAQDVLATSALPAFAPLWIPLSRTGGAASAEVHCDERGQADASSAFCVFARLALQPGAGHTLVVILHGMFDSGAQRYVQRMAAGLYRLGHSVLLPDMRDHGDTLRAAPALATTLGTLEGSDVLALVRAARQACGARIGRAGVAGVSGGGLNALRALTLDGDGTLNAGVIAISPLLDVPQTISDLTQTGPCPLTRGIELSWTDDLAIAAAGGVGFFAGAASVQALAGRRLDADTALAAAIGAGAGLLASLAVDAWFDGGSQPCVAENAIARIVQDTLSVRWRALLQPRLGQTMSPAARRIAPEAITIDAYLNERVDFLARRLGVKVSRFEPHSLARELQSALHARRERARVFVLTAADDPMTRVAAADRFSQLTRGTPQLYTHVVAHGGHGGMWEVQPVVMQRMFEVFFAADTTTTVSRMPSTPTTAQR